MAIQRYLSKTPITEAIIDLRVKLPPDFEVIQFSKLKEKLHERYPKMVEYSSTQAGIGIMTGKQPGQFTKDMDPQGFFFKSEDECNVAQFRVDGFTFNRLKPYTTWDKIFSEASQLWDLYKETSSPERITRIAVRYTNHLRIPLPIRRLSQYLTAPPAIPDNVPNSVSSFLTRVVIDDQETGLTANITQALEKNTDPQNIMIILDIDVYKQEDFEIGEERVWPIFNELRNMKNRIFFGSITEETIRIFE